MRGGAVLVRLGVTALGALNSVQIPAKANSGRSSLIANHTTSFFLATGFGSGTYSEKLLAGTRHRFFGFSQPRQCGDAVLRMLVTGGAPNFGGGGIPNASWLADDELIDVRRLTFRACSAFQVASPICCCSALYLGPGHRLRRCRQTLTSRCCFCWESCRWYPRIWRPSLPQARGVPGPPGLL